jgi:PTH1 family peptidyl-tRNA hydrolase
VSSGIQLIVGLGNPGAEYENTRHNAGAWFVTELLNDLNVCLRFNTKFQGLHGSAKIQGKDCHFLIPETFMNLSGQSVQAVANFYKIPAHAILVAHDEIDLPVATVRLKLDGGHGGHNGLRDIISHLSTKQFYRLRIGVGHPGNSALVVDYVLHSPSKTDRSKINTALLDAKSILPLLLDGEYQKATQQLHTEPRE